jgi:hypothetical protein
MTTTTADFQKKPDYYESREKCIASKRHKVQTNPRYRDFTQTNFTAGDPEQFETYRDATNSINPCIQDIPLTDNLFYDQPFESWDGYKNLHADTVVNTFKYIFDKFKKGIFVKIVNNELKVFLPFSKHHFCNEWGNRIKVNPKYGNMMAFLRHVNDLEGRGYKFAPHRVNVHTDSWFGNNCLVRYEKPLSEGENNVTNVKNMLETLCASRKVPDIEFFVNRRDFPILTKDGTEAYNHIWDSTSHPVVSHLYPQYSPILSMCSGSRYADETLPTHEDWARVQSGKKWFPPSCREYPSSFPTLWANKKETAVFRGGTTGCGVTIDTNQRLKLSYLSKVTPVAENGVPYLDAGVTNWNVRPRKVQGEQYITTIEPRTLPFGLLPELTVDEQSQYKYIINVDGHVAAFRLSIELNMGSVVMIVDSPWKIWYRDMLKPWIHYIPVKEDLSDIVDRVKWCREHDKECEQIAQAAREFYNKYLLEDGILDFTQKLLVNLKAEMNVYLYNTSTPLNILIGKEFNGLSYDHPVTSKSPSSISTIPSTSRNYGLLQGLEWVVNMSILNGDFQKTITSEKILFSNKLSEVYESTMAGFPIVRKTTDDYRKAREHVHEAFIGTKSINHLLTKIPNFAYTFAGYEDPKRFCVISERIYGQTLHQYLMSKEFNMQEFVFIIVQVCLALKIAQDTCALVHYDLTPWNIILQRWKTPTIIDYAINIDTIYRVKTSIVPVIIDYGKSHVIYKGEHHGFINPYSVSTVQDILTLLLTSMKQISDIRLPQQDFSSLIRLADFLTNTEYKKERFKTASDLKDFLHNNCHYSEITTSPKYDLEKKGPMDLVEYIQKNIQYKLPVSKVDNYSNVMSRGNARQVFEYILSANDEERLQSYMDVFYRVKMCSIPQPTNLFFLYYVAQVMDENLVSVTNSLEVFAALTKVDTSNASILAQETVEYIRKLYKGIIKKNDQDKDIEYDIVDSKQLTQASYTEETFLNPSKILALIQPYRDNDLAEYKNMVMKSILDTGYFSLDSEARSHYTQNFGRLLRANSLNMQNNSANIKTLNSTAKTLYSADIEFFPKSQCDILDAYKKLYNEILVKIE